MVWRRNMLWPSHDGCRVNARRSYSVQVIEIHSKVVPRVANRQSLAALVLASAAILLATACTPTVRVATDEPITINLNVNIKHEILVKVDKDLDDLFSDNSELF